MINKILNEGVLVNRMKEENIEIIKLEDSNNEIFDIICKWNYNWWGKRNHNSFEEVRCNLKHSLCKNRLPQTFVALIDGKPVGMYQLSMTEDLESRPDIYPWLINVYVEEKYRGHHIGRKLLETVNENAKKANLKELFLYTKHRGLYEKFGWEFIEYVETFKPDSPIERLYKLKIK